jgi:hypothetical protein
MRDNRSAPDATSAAHELVDAKLRTIDRAIEDAERTTRTELLAVGGAIDVDAVDSLFAANRQEWTAFRAELVRAILVASEGDWSLINTLAAPCRTKADDDRASGRSWTRL